MRKIVAAALAVLLLGGAGACGERETPVCTEDMACWGADSMGNGDYDPRVWDCRTEGDRVCQDAAPLISGG